MVMRAAPVPSPFWIVPLSTPPIPASAALVSADAGGGAPPRHHPRTSNERTSRVRVNALGFFIAYFTEDEVLSLHVWAGYAVGILVVLRVVWGFVGPKHARFTDFLFGPGEVIAYLVDLIRFRAKRYLGHSPAGGAMAIALWLGLLAVALALAGWWSWRRRARVHAAR